MPFCAERNAKSRDTDAIADVSEGHCPLCHVALITHDGRAFCPCGGCSYRLEGEEFEMTTHGLDWLSEATRCRCSRRSGNRNGSVADFHATNRSLMAAP